MMLVLNIIAVLSTITLRKKKEVIRLSILSVIGIFLANGVNKPFGYFYEFLLHLPIAGFQYLVKYPNIFISIMHLALSLLISVFVAVAFDNILSFQVSKRFRILFIITFFFALCLLIIFSPLNSDTFNKMVTPVQLPSGYLKANEFLLRDSDNFRVMWVPLSTAFNFSANSLPNRAEYWITPKPPSLLYGWGIRNSLSPIADTIYTSFFYRR
ncbi:hypothetical protein [Saccharolobus sp.]|uniref:hypothetical protein n=1 Tax=Saccharolobus sp. TaxID=2100761 RepID=UPI00316297A8